MRIGETGFIPVGRAGGAGAASGIEPAQPAGGASFGDELTKAISAVDKTQTDADVEATRLAGGAGNLHETALALEKADVSMRVLMKARNKLIDAYTEIMRMSV